jgi:hypothetical protein
MPSSCAIPVIEEERVQTSRSLRTGGGGEDAVGERRKAGNSAARAGSASSRRHSNLSFPTTSAFVVSSRAHAEKKTNSKILRDLASHPATLRAVCPRMRPRNIASSGGSDLLCPALCSAWRRHLQRP